MDKTSEFKANPLLPWPTIFGLSYAGESIGKVGHCSTKLGLGTRLIKPFFSCSLLCICENTHSRCQGEKHSLTGVNIFSVSITQWEKCMIK